MPSPVSAETWTAPAWRFRSRRRVTSSQRSILFSTSSRGISSAPISLSTDSTAAICATSSSSSAEASHDVQDEVARERLLERRREGLDQAVRQLPDEPDRVRDDVGASEVVEGARRRVERVEEAVGGRDLGAGERVQQRRLADVRVAGERDRGQRVALAPLAQRRRVCPHALEAPLEQGDAVAGEPAVGLELGLARASCADAAAEPLEVLPHPAHALQVVLELGELDLELALGAVGMQSRRCRGSRGSGRPRASRACPRGGAAGSASDRPRTPRPRPCTSRHSARSSSTLPLADVGPGVGRGAVLHDLADDLDAGGTKELVHLGELARDRRPDVALRRAPRARARRIELSVSSARHTSSASSVEPWPMRSIASASRSSGTVSESRT